MEWLLDTAGVADWREVEVLRRHPQVLARFVAERLEANLAVARVTWQHLDQLVAGAATPAARDEVTAGTRALLEHEGPRAATAVISARLLEQALSGGRWVPRL